MRNKMNKLIFLLRGIEKYILMGTIADGDSTKYLYQKINNAIKVLEEKTNGNLNERELNELLLEFKEFYHTLFHPRVGLSSLFIWKDDYDERIKINNELELLKNDITEMLKSV